jgi:7-carboxy-7-deazaguanine synthase
MMSGLQILNTQKPEPKVKGDGAELDIVEIYHTIQGEATFAGRPAVFVRLAGCTILCPGCDTNYTTGRRLTMVCDIVSEVRKVGRKASLVVLTGGEPFRQPVRRLCRALNIAGYTVQVETNGTVWDPGSAAYIEHVICSPKTSKILPETASYVTGWKYVVTSGLIDPVDGLPTASLSMQGRPARPTNDRPVFIQPCDMQDPKLNAENTRAAIDTCMAFGYTLCLQIHKMIDLP